VVPSLWAADPGRLRSPQIPTRKRKGKKRKILLLLRLLLLLLQRKKERKEGRGGGGEEGGGKCCFSRQHFVLCTVSQPSAWYANKKCVSPTHH
jgi:hypothetical protein